MKKKSIESLRNSFDGKVYVRFSSEEVFRRFLEGAESEGYTLGGKRPAEAAVSSDIKAVEYDKTISNCGVISHIACHAGGENIHVIDYEKYINGDDNFIYEHSPRRESVRSGGTVEKHD